MKKIITLFLLFQLFISNAQQLTPSQFIDVAGKQRMLSQKIAKNFMIITYGVTDAKIQTDLKIATSIFERNLEILFKNTNKNNALLSALQEEEKAWKRLSKEIKKQKIPEVAVEAMNLSSDLLKVANDVVVLAEQQFITTGKSRELLKLINRSGKQRMLSQKLCLLFVNQKIQSLLKRKYRSGTDGLEAVFKEMDVSIGTLLTTPYNTIANTETQIGEVSVEFDRIKQKKQDFIKGDLSVQEVFQITNNLTKLYNNLTFAYSKIQE